MNFGVDRGTAGGSAGVPASWDADLVDYTPPNGGTEESVQDALQRIVHRGQYPSQGAYEAARDALSETTGVNNLEVTGTLEVDGVNVMTSLKAFAVAMAVALG